MELNMSYEDWNHHYNGCIGKLNYPSQLDEVVLFYYQGFDVNANDNHVMVGSYTTLSKKEEDMWTPISVEFQRQDVTIDFTWPRLGLFNFNKACSRLSQMPMRQWRRGYNLTCIYLFNISQRENGILGRRDLTLDDLNRARLVKEIFYPRYFSPYEAYTSIYEGKRLSCAISKNLYNQIVMSCPHIFLGYKTTIIGIVDQPPQGPLTARLFHGNEFLREQVEHYYHVGDYI